MDANQIYGDTIKQIYLFITAVLTACIFVLYIKFTSKMKESISLKEEFTKRYNNLKEEFIKENETLKLALRSEKDNSSQLNAKLAVVENDVKTLKIEKQRNEAGYEYMANALRESEIKHNEEWNDKKKKYKENIKQQSNKIDELNINQEEAIKSVKADCKKLFKA